MQLTFVYTVGVGPGKTAIILYAMIVRACKVKSRHLILRLTFNSAKRSIWLDSLQSILVKAFPNLKVKWNKTDYYLELPNGSQIFIGGLDDKERTEKVLGTEFSSIFFEEVSQISYTSLQIAVSRLAEKNSLKKKCFYAMNPPSMADWQYWLFEKKLNPIDDEPLKDPENYKSMLLVPADNIENIDESYISLLESMPKKEKDRFLYGLYSNTDNDAAFYAFDSTKHVGPTKVVPGTKHISMDFNFFPFCALISQFYDNKFHIHDEIYLENADTYKMCDELKRRGYAGLDVIPDSSGANRRTSGKSDFDILRENGFKILSTHNPFQKDRVNNCNRLLSADRVLINPVCKKLINDLHKQVWKDSKLYSGKDKMLGHMADAFGYLLYKLEPIGAQTQKMSSYQR